MSLGPLDWTGPAFLTLYFTLFVIAAVISFTAPRRLYPEGYDRTVTDPEELAWLVGGQTRTIDAAVVRLLTAGTIELRGRNRFGPGRAYGPRPITAETNWSGLAWSLRTGAAAVQARLRRAGMLVDAATLRRLRSLAALPLLLLLAFGAAKWLVGFERERDLGLLSFTMIGASVMLVMRLATLDQRTDSGRAAVARAWATHDRLRRAPLREEMPLAVGLYGTGVLTGSEFADFHAIRSSRGGVSTSSGGDGGCGGGCGGCGGGD